MSASPRPDSANKELIQEAEMHCKLVVWLWLIGGCIYASISGGFSGLPILALFFPGIFVACRIAWAAFNVYINLRSAVDALEARGSRAAWLLCGLCLAWSVASMMVAPVWFAVLYLRLVRGLLHQP